MKRWAIGSVAVVAVVISPLLVMYALRWIDGRIPASPEPCGLPGPVLAASAGDGRVTLSWRLVHSPKVAVKGWQYMLSAQGRTIRATPDVGPATTSHTVTDLLNGVAYTFQVRPQLGTAGFGCWSAGVSVVPRLAEDLMGQIEEHQDAIASGVAGLVEGMAARQELLQQLGGKGVTALSVVATSTSAIAEHAADIRDGVARVAANVGTAGENVAVATAAVSREVAGIREEVGKVAVSVDAAGQKVADELSGITEKLGGSCGECGTTPHGCRKLGSVSFGHGSHVIEDEKGDLGRIETELGSLERSGGLFLAFGHATSIGHAVYNMHLSDERAMCVSRCLRDRFGVDVGEFAFREIARGEVFQAGDLAGSAPRNQRVDVAFCPGYFDPTWDAEGQESLWPSAKECGCSGAPA